MRKTLATLGCIAVAAMMSVSAFATASVSEVGLQPFSEAPVIGEIDKQEAAIKFTNLEVALHKRTREVRDKASKLDEPIPAHALTVLIHTEVAETTRMS